MSAAYKQFLASPSASLLADNASLHYITTLSNFSGATEILKHLTALRRQVTKKQEEILSLVEAQDAIVVEVHTALEFITSGGIYLPKLDDNFLSDRTAYVAITHFVSFDANGKIVQIRQQWDQGALLKQLDIVGKTGRNWPIQDSREQLRQIQSCLKTVGKSAQQASNQNDVVIRTRHNTNNALRDPHASLNLYGTREEIESAPLKATANPYAGHRPSQRSVIDIIGDEPEEGESGHNRHRSVSPSKAGSHKNFQPSRIFDGKPEYVEEMETPKKSDKFIKPHPTKYNHFDFVDGSDPRDAPARGVDLDNRPKSKHDSQWSFDDFVTPAKPTASKGMRSRDVQHWNPEMQFSADPEERHPTGKGRRDAETHFEIQDDGEKDARQERVGLPRGAMHNEGQSLYKNQLFDEVDPTPGPKRALNTVTNLKDRSKDFDPHFEMTDESPSQPPRTQHAPEGKVKMAKMMDHNWEVYEQSPLKENNRPRPAPAATGSGQKIHIAGDGMGSRKGATHSDQDTKIHIAGDGMGGRKGTSRAWMTGGDDEEEQPKTQPRGRGTAAAKKTDGFWDF
ncbi:NTF2-like protein [Cordyceps javanica]|uniref:NTF2-like protein n=1 Tax=Cordyceps javanica TaxID=43265 RepID=A0A545W710_9HYPO|nr:NTF2-like protein [Cordyceps javanica]TQW09655.1 NTF2-like protein [Cordyceps javanica]